MATRAGLIEVVMKDGSRCRMAPRALDLFLDRNQVRMFKRSGGWAVIGIDPIRSRRSECDYRGTERRSHLSIPSPSHS